MRRANRERERERESFPGAAAAEAAFVPCLKPTMHTRVPASHVCAVCVYGESIYLYLFHLPPFSGISFGSSSAK